MSFQTALQPSIESTDAVLKFLLAATGNRDFALVESCEEEEPREQEAKDDDADL